jgi:catechol 2,3-dioxygenase-like lactoylglutathione lyase family enzyme
MTFRYHHLHLICSDLARTEDFFTRDLGATVVEHRKFGTAAGAVLDLHGVRINLRTRRDGDAITGDSASPRYGYDHLGFEIDDVDAAYKTLSGKGYAFVGPPQQAGDLKVAFFKGPDNITIELVQVRS